MGFIKILVIRELKNCNSRFLILRIEKIFEIRLAKITYICKNVLTTLKGVFMTNFNGHKEMTL